MEYFSLITYECWKEDTHTHNVRQKKSLTVFWSAENGRIKEACCGATSTVVAPTKKKVEKTQTWRRKAITLACVISWCITESWKLTLQQKIQLKLDDKVDIILFFLLHSGKTQSGEFLVLGYRPHINQTLFLVNTHTHINPRDLFSIIVFVCTNERCTMCATDNNNNNNNNWIAMATFPQAIKSN